MLIKKLNKLYLVLTQLPGCRNFTSRQKMAAIVDQASVQNPLQTFAQGRIDLEHKLRTNDPVFNGIEQSYRRVWENINLAIPSNDYFVIPTAFIKKVEQSQAQVPSLGNSLRRLRDLNEKGQYLADANLIGTFEYVTYSDDYEEDQTIKQIALRTMGSTRAEYVDNSNVDNCRSILDTIANNFPALYTRSMQNIAFYADQIENLLSLRIGVPIDNIKRAVRAEYRQVGSRHLPNDIKDLVQFIAQLDFEQWKKTWRPFISPNYSIKKVYDFVQMQTHSLYMYIALGVLD